METNELQNIQPYATSTQEAITDINYSAADFGDNPTVNLATGRLKYSFADLSIGHTSYAINVGHIYNSKLCPAFANKIVGMGAGWKLNLHQVLIPDDPSQNPPQYYKYLDADGEVHRFVKYDTNKYYDDRNAKTTLTYAGTTQYITDGVGNTLYFQDGLLVGSVSCYNKYAEKTYEYDSNNRLVRVYDERNKNGSAYKSRIEFEYNDDGLLQSMTSYGVNSKKLFGMTYSYNSAGQLVEARKVGYGKNSNSSVTKQMLNFQYNTQGKLTRVVDVETKLATRVDYSGDRVVKVENEVYIPSATQLGSKDGNNSIVQLGAVTCGVGAKAEYKSRNIYKKFVYALILGSSDVSNETVVTDEKGISISYGISREARIVSSFELEGDNYKTLEKQGENILVLPNDSPVRMRINGINARAVTSSFTLDMKKKDIARNVQEHDNQFYSYSFWVYSIRAYDRLEAVMTYTFDTGTKQTSSVFLDGQAQQAWQRVTLPITLPLKKDKPQTDAISNIQVKFMSGNTVCNSEFYVASIGFAPAPKVEMELASRKTSSGKIIYTPLVDFTTIAINGESKQIRTGDVYFTESDVIATFTNKYLHLYTYLSKPSFDVICNNGSKRIGNVYSLIWSKSGESTPENVGIPCQNVTHLSSTAIITTEYDFLSIENDKYYIVNSCTVDGKSETSSTTTVINQYGDTESETDEYGVTTRYIYDDEGNLIQKKVEGTNNGVWITETHSYVDGKPQDVIQGTYGQRFDYNTFDIPYKATDVIYKSNTRTLKSCSTNVTHNLYQNKPLDVKLVDGAYNSIASNNIITYDNGHVRTITDGLVKYGVKKDVLNNKVEYTQFEDGKEVVRQSKITSNWFEKPQGQKTRTLFDRAIKKVGSEEWCISTEEDNYGHVQSIKRNQAGAAQAAFTVTYDSPQESMYTAQPREIVDPVKGTQITNSYDTYGNLTGWTESVKTSSATHKRLSVTQLTANRTSYNYGSNINYIHEVEYDSDKILSPRVVGHSVIPENVSSQEQDKDYICRTKYEYDQYGRASNKKKVISNYTPNDGDYSTQQFDFENKGPSYVIKTNKFTNDRYNSYYNTVYSVKLTENNTHDDCGRLTAQQKTFSYSHGSKAVPVGNRKIQYDNIGRVKSESFDTLNLQRTFSYRPDGRIDYVIQNGNKLQREYDSLGRLIKNGTQSYLYDEHGNRIRKNNSTEYTYNCGKLASVDDTTYTYGANGLICNKNGGYGVSTYYYDGGKLLRENEARGEWLFFYDMHGLSHCCYSRHAYYPDTLTPGYYQYVLDSQGSVALILNSNGQLQARYEYDILGNCTVFDANGNVDTNKNSIGNRNPFRWKSYYFDIDSGLYYVNGRHYDPEVGLYVDAAPISTVIANLFALLPLDRYGLMCNNILEFARNAFTFATTIRLNADPEYEDPESRPYLGNFLLGGVILMLTLPLALWGVPIWISFVLAGLSAIGGGITYDSRGHIRWDWESSADGFLWGSIIGVASTALGALWGGVGSGLSLPGRMLAQGGINFGIAGALTLAHGLATDDFIWYLLGVSMFWGFQHGVVGVLSIGFVLRLVVTLIIGAAQTVMEEIVEFLYSIYS